MFRDPRQRHGVPWTAAISPGYGSGESALDIEDVIGVAPQAKILVYEAPSTWVPVDNLDRIATDDRAQVVSSSWGACEAQLPSGEAASENTVFEQMAFRDRLSSASPVTRARRAAFPTDSAASTSPSDTDRPTGLALNQTSQTLYTTLASDGKVEVVNATTSGPSMAADVTVGYDPTAVAWTAHPGGIRGQQGDGTVSVFSTSSCNAAKVLGCTAR